MPGWAHLTGGPASSPDLGDMPPTMIYGTEAYAADLRTAHEAGANAVHVKFRGRSLAEYLEQFDAFAEEVVPLVNEG